MFRTQRSFQKLTESNHKRAGTKKATVVYRTKHIVFHVRRVNFLKMGTNRVKVFPNLISTTVI